MTTNISNDETSVEVCSAGVSAAEHATAEAVSPTAKRRRKLTTALWASMIALALAGSSFAYLTAMADDVNVMTVGEVKIEQIEQERDSNGKLVDFTQDKPAYPVVGEIKWDETKLEINGAECNMFDDELKNVIDKIVTVKNTGRSDAYVRTIVALEAPEGFDDSLIHLSTTAQDGVNIQLSDWVEADFNGTQYLVISLTYDEPLASGAISAPSLKQVFLDSRTTNEDCALLGDTWEIKVLSQAVQTNGYNKATDALDTAFGELNPENAAKWFKDVEAPVAVETADEFTQALIAGKSVVLAGDIELTTAVVIPESVRIDLDGRTLSTVGLKLENGGSIKNGTIASVGNTSMTPHLSVSGGTLTMEDVDVEVTHYLNYQAQGNRAYAEFTGLDVSNATVVLDGCELKAKNGTYCTWSYVYGICVNNGTVAMNGGSIVIESAGASSTDLKTAVSGIGTSTVSLCNVEVLADTYGTTMGHLVVSTTDSSVADSDFVSYGGTYELKYIG